VTLALAGITPFHSWLSICGGYNPLKGMPNAVCACVHCRKPAHVPVGKASNQCPAYLDRGVRDGRQAVRTLLLDPSKGVLEGVLLTAHRAAEVDQLMLERDLVFGLQIPTVECRIIGAEAVIDPRLVELSRHLAHGGKICKSPGLQVRARTEFETDAPLAQLRYPVPQSRRAFSPTAHPP